MNTPINVGLGEQSISQDENDILVAYGLGSCVAVSMVDTQRKVSGLIHCVLPERQKDSDPYSSKYVDSGLVGMLEAMIRHGANPGRLLVKIAGGANMLTPFAVGRTFDIGTRNVQAARQVLERLHLKINGENVGGHTGRTVRLYVSTGRMTVRMVGGTELEL
jgi:chemotaxis protein CheD